jgi:hypothetical protein
MFKLLLFNTAFLCILELSLFPQAVSNEEIKRRVELYKTNLRGPYKEIRWFCKDGSILPPNERCPDPGGVQRASYKDEVRSLSLSNHVFLGQILSTTPFPDFWDAENHHSRLKQYQLEKYLRAIDDGWILRRAQYYRGAFQAEDEEEWGIAFYDWLLSDDRLIEQHFFLIRQSLKDLPHEGDNNLTQNIRTVSRVISDQYPAFLDLRVKIHGQPDITDLEKVELFRENNKHKMDEDLSGKLEELIGDMKKLYKPVDLKSLTKYLDHIPEDAEIKKSISGFISDYGRDTSERNRIDALSSMIFELRKEILSVRSGRGRLAILDISIVLEEVLKREQSGLEMNDIKACLENIYDLGLAAAGCGYLERWEWENISTALEIPEGPEAELQQVMQFFASGRNLTDWGTGMYRANYMDVIELYSGFEKSAGGFLDEKVRSSLLLNVGISVSRLGDFLSVHLPGSNEVMGIMGQNNARGLNPGYARGELVVVVGQTERVAVDKDKIYIFDRPPYDLQPVAGIATVTEGNPVSHIQLLARNLGIPNAVITPQILDTLKMHNGEFVFYAVSAGGIVVLKPVNQMNPEEEKLFETRQRKVEKVKVPVEKIHLAQAKIINLREVNARSSGIVCGPKAANLGQLKKMFPDHVVEGIVIPFGIFREHLDQMMPGQTVSYWVYLNNIFRQSGRMHESGKSDQDIESYILEELGNFRKAIGQITLMDGFLQDLEASFQAAFGKKIGDVPVFLRSDTNMEDLKDFTGAGLNLTLFNVVAYETIIQGIRDVWASPYTERSYRWRQQYLLNPENVFPSILIIPSVDVDHSGVMVTRGISSQDDDDLSIAFNRGAGGAVEGQAAESYLLKADGRNILRSPARETVYNRLPVSGGTKKYYATFEAPVLSDENLGSLRNMADQIKRQLPSAPGIETNGPFDVELGFRDNELWLFQVRPFVENKNAAASKYLNSLNPDIRGNKRIRILETQDIDKETDR